MGKTSIVIYYSQSGTTREIAEKIKNLTGSDLYEIRSEKQYDSDMWKAYEEAKWELQTGNMPKLSGAILDLSAYQTIYIGSPVWGGTLANPVMVFLNEVDFHHAQVIPFWSFYDYEGDYEKNIIRQCKNAEMRKGIGISNHLYHSRAFEDFLKKRVG